MSPLRPFQGLSPTVPTSAWVAPSADVIGEVLLGEDVNIWYQAVLRGDVMPIEIGARTNIQDLAMVHATTGISRTVIGADVTVGHNAILHGCTVGDGSLIGMGAILLDNVEIGARCLVGAGSVVPPNKKFPDGVVLIGNPAKVVRETTPEEHAAFLESARHYVNLARQHARP